MKWISIVISLFAFVGTIYTYFRHDKKLKKQQGELNEQGKLINKYTIDKIEVEKEDAKKANVKARLTKTTTKGTIGTLTVYNDGKADAINVRIEVDPNNKIESEKRQEVLDAVLVSNFPLNILPPNCDIENTVRLHTYFPNILEVKLIWGDDYESNRESKIPLSIR